MTGTSRELTISHGAQFPAQCLLGDDDAEFLEDPLAEVDDPPAHDAMQAGIGPLSSIAASAARCAPFRPDGCPGGLQSISPSGPWALNLITQSRTIWSVIPPISRRLGPARAVVNRRQRQKPPGLRPILRPPCGSPHHPRIKISPKWNGHGEPPALATLNQTHADSGI
jgi:hypothetical protein